jgi:hypothetical protein
VPGKYSPAPVYFTTAHAHPLPETVKRKQFPSQESACFATFSSQSNAALQNSVKIFIENQSLVNEPLKITHPFLVC